MRLAIVEDERSDRMWILDCLKRYEREHNLKFEIAQFEDSDSFLHGYRAEYDLILMDIEMAFLDGMAAAREVREVDNEVLILFITNAPQYVMNGYEVGALDYLLKPVTYFALEKRIDRAFALLDRRRRNFVKLNVKGGFQKVEVGRVLYVETDAQGLCYHTLDGVFHTRGSLQAAEALLDDRRFFRCNKCYLVNISYIDSMVGNDLRIGGDVIQVSRSGKKPLLDVMNRYFSETIL
jgi:DNA-binding LytR/AlgR family response regulator